MSRLSLRALSVALCFTLPACGVEGEEPAAASFAENARAVEAESVSFELSGESAQDADSADAQVVDAIVCVGHVCVTMKATLVGNTLIVELPVDRSLIGMPITATVPGVGVFTGTYSL